MSDLTADSLGKELAEALDEIDSLRGNQLILARERNELERENAALRKDAARYRWLMQFLKFRSTGRKLYRKLDEPRFEVTLTRFPNSMEVELPPLLDEYEICGAAVLGEFPSVEVAIDAAMGDKEKEHLSGTSDVDRSR